MSRIASLAVAAAIIAVSVGLAALLVSMAPEPARTEPPPQIPFAQTGRVTAGSGAIPVHGAGTVRPSVEIDVAPQVGGRVVWVDPGFQSGGRVEAGRTLFRIEEADYLSRLREAEAHLAARRAALLEEEERAAIARAQYEMYSRRQGDGDPVPAAGPLALREPQLEAARAALKRDEAPARRRRARPLQDPRDRALRRLRAPRVRRCGTDREPRREGGPALRRGRR